MTKFAVAAFLTAFLFSYVLAGPGTPMVVARALGMALIPWGVGFATVFFSRRNESSHPFLWGAASMALVILLMFMGQD